MKNPTTIQNINMFLISPSPMNPRKSFAKEDLKELATNIEKQGLLQPITVRPVESNSYDYEIVCGERRYRACSILAMETIPCIVREMTDDEALDAMITENLQRKDVDPVEEAVAFNLLNERGQSVEDLALRFGKSQSYVRDRMRLVSLIQPLRKSLSIEQLPLKGAYLLARLSADAQQEFFEDELDGDYQLQISCQEVEDWLDSYFMNLWRSPFQDGKTLKEEWNPKGKLTRRCDKCDCNTCNHGCLFADMKTEEPQCIDRVCFERKTDIYYDWFVQQYDHRITRKGQPIQHGDVVIFKGYAYGRDDVERQDAIVEKLTMKGYCVFTEKELPNGYWNRSESLKNDLKTGKIIECIDLSAMVSRRSIDISYRYLPGDQASTSAAYNGSNLVARLCERSASIERNMEKAITKRAKEVFDKDTYIARTSQFEDWEQDVMAAIVFDMVPWTEQDELIPGTRSTHATYQQIRKFRSENGLNYSWMRRAIASFIFKEHKQSFLAEAAANESVAASADIKAIRRKAQERIDTINEELREMGYDEKGNRL